MTPDDAKKYTKLKMLAGISICWVKVVDCPDLQRGGAASFVENHRSVQVGFLCLVVQAVKQRVEWVRAGTRASVVRLSVLQEHCHWLVVHSLTEVHQ